MPADAAGIVAIDAIVLTRDASAYAYGHRRVAYSDLYLADGLR